MAYHPGPPEDLAALLNASSSAEAHSSHSEENNSNPNSDVADLGRILDVDEDEAADDEQLALDSRHPRALASSVAR